MAPAPGISLPSHAARAATLRLRAAGEARQAGTCFTLAPRREAYGRTCRAHRQRAPCAASSTFPATSRPRQRGAANIVRACPSCLRWRLRRGGAGPPPGGRFAPRSAAARSDSPCHQPWRSAAGSSAISLSLHRRANLRGVSPNLPRCARRRRRPPPAALAWC